MRAVSKMKTVLLALAVVALQSMAGEKQKFDPDAMFGIELDSLLPADQQSRRGDTNYVQCIIRWKSGTLWLKAFRGFSPFRVSTGVKGEVVEVEAIRDQDIDRTRLPKLLNAMDKYFAGFDGISPSGDSDTNRTWAGISQDGRAYEINVYENHRNPNGTVAVWMSLHSDLSHGNAELRAARIDRQLKSRDAAAYRMMQENAYEGVWGRADRRLQLLLCFIKGGLGLAEYQERYCPFYWTSDGHGNVEAVVALGGGLLSKMTAKFVPDSNAFKVRLEYPDDKEILERLADSRGEGEDGGVASGQRKAAMAETRVEHIAGKNIEGKMREFIERSFDTGEVLGPLTNTVPRKISAAQFDFGLKLTKTVSLGSLADLPALPAAGKRGYMVLKGQGGTKLMVATDENGKTFVCVTIGEMSKNDVNAPSYAWLELARPRMRSAAAFESRIPNGLPEETCEKIAKTAAEFGEDVEEQVMELDMFWHYRREDMLQFRFSREKSDSALAFIKKAFDGVLEFPAEVEMFE